MIAPGKELDTVVNPIKLIHGWNNRRRLRLSCEMTPIKSPWFLFSSGIYLCQVRLKQLPLYLHRLVNLLTIGRQKNIFLSIANFAMEGKVYHENIKKSEFPVVFTFR